MQKFENYRLFRRPISGFYSRTDFNYFPLNTNKTDVGTLSKVSLHNVDFLPIVGRQSFLDFDNL